MIKNYLLVSSSELRSLLSNRENFGCLGASAKKKMRPARACGPHRATVEQQSSGLEQPKLGQRRYAIIEADLLNDLAVDHLQHRGASEAHLAASRGWKAADQEILEGRTRMGATTFPLADDVVALGNQIRGAPEIEIGEGGAEIGYERLDIVAAATGFMQRVFEQHVR